MTDLQSASLDQQNDGKRKLSASSYKSYENAQEFAASLNLKSRKEWREYVKGFKPHLAVKPADVPAHPDGIYKTSGWQGWRHWLGTEKATYLQ